MHVLDACPRSEAPAELVSISYQSSSRLHSVLAPRNPSPSRAQPGVRTSPPLPAHALERSSAPVHRGLVRMLVRVSRRELPQVRRGRARSGCTGGLEGVARSPVLAPRRVGRAEGEDDPPVPRVGGGGSWGQAWGECQGYIQAHLGLGLYKIRQGLLELA